MNARDDHRARTFWCSRGVGIWFLVWAWSISGCGPKAPNYVPPPDTARQALETALNAWQSGQPVGKTIERTSLRVQTVDSGWGKGQKLTRYEILEEVARPDGKRCFKVRLHLQKPQSIQEVHYLVVGKSPMWIFRAEDYQN